MNIEKLQKIKKEALEENIPIIMDDTLETLDKILKNMNLNKVLEIGTAVRLFCHMFYKLFNYCRNY